MPAPETAGQEIKCLAAVVRSPGVPYEVEEVYVAPPKAGEVRVKILFAAACHTDQLTQRGVDPQGQYPCILGHEAAGIVESVGEGVVTCRPGDHVIPLWQADCFETDRECETCKNCRGVQANVTNLCAKYLDCAITGGMKIDGKPRFRACKDGAEIKHFMGTSAFSQYTVLHQEGIAVINPAAPLNLVCLLGCGVATGMGAAINSAKVSKGSTVAVLGLGAVGLACVLGCKLSGASIIICVDVNGSKERDIAKFGGTKFLNPLTCEKPIQDVIVEMTNGGVDFAFECAGSVAVMKTALESTHKGWGTAVILGIGEAGHEIRTRPYNFIVGRKLMGSLFGGWRGRRDIPKLVEKCLNREFGLEDFVTHRLPLKEINQAFELLSKAECLRCVLSMNE